jgi:hypothetical protein
LKRIIEIVFFVFLFTSVAYGRQVNKADSLHLKKDSISPVMMETQAKRALKQAKDTVDTLSAAKFKPDPVKVLWMGAIIPGYGQILNRRYWKLPIVYAGFLGCAYAVSYNSRSYETYKLAYKDISDDDPDTNSFLDILPSGTTLENYPGGESGLKSNLSTAYEQKRRYRDLSIIGSVAYYAITLVEAYVDAQLFDFDISTDLSLHIRPALLQNKFGTSNSPGFQLSLNLK